MFHNFKKTNVSKNNTINIFLPEKQLKKQIMGIKTDSKPINEPKDPENCNVFKIYSLLASKTDIDDLRKLYLAEGMGYGHAKQLLLNLILEYFSVEREKYNYFHQNPEEVYIALAKGAEKARKVANEVLLRVRNKIGY